MSESYEGLFERALTYPDVDMRYRLSKLVGLDDHRSRLSKTISIFIYPDLFKRWLRKQYSNSEALAEFVERKPPLIILAGDVGSGKTELAETIADDVAREHGIPITLIPLSLSSRGQGRVGEMTQLISAAFSFVLSEGQKMQNKTGKPKGAIVLHVDEADAIAQSREASQMHHEDKAGVNAFIRGIDSLAKSCLPVAVIMCTNRADALDPAVRRRAADILLFDRPSNTQRREVLEKALNGLHFGPGDFKSLVDVTGISAERDYGFTFSDLTQRLIPAIALDAYPAGQITATRSLEIARKMSPTKPFREA